VYLYNLCERLGDPAENAAARQLAGLLLKNTFFARDEQTRLFMTQRWLMLPVDQRSAIKEQVLASLSADVKEARSAASQVVSRIAAIEVPRKQWDDFVSVMFGKLQPSCTTASKESALEVLQFVSEEIGDLLSARSGEVLGAIAANIQPACEVPVRHAAVKALGSVLEIAESNMASPNERKLIMEMIFGAAQDGDKEVRLRAYEALNKLPALYYTVIPEFAEAVYAMTNFGIQDALKTGYEPIGIQSIEFWSSVCDVETELTEINISNMKSGKPQEAVANLAFSVYPKILPLLCQCLTKQTDEPGDDTWNLFAAAGDMIAKAAQAIRDPIVQMTLPFIQENIKNPDWRVRDAATVAFGAILSGPSSETLDGLVQAAFSTIIQHVQDQSAHVRDSAIWVVGKICESAPGALSEEMVVGVLQVLVECLQREPRIASLSCWAIHNLAIAFGAEFSDSESSPMSKYFQHVVSSVFAAAQREDADEANLMSTAFEAMNLLVVNCTDDCVPIVQELFMAILGKMQALGQSGEGASQELQGYLCSLLQACLTKVPEETIARNADHVMVLLLSVLQNENALLYEEAMMAVGSVINAVKGSFKAYVGAFRRFLMAALRNVQDHRVNMLAVSVVSDLAHALGPDITSLCDEILTIFLQNLQSNMLDREAKPVIISTMGDIALAITSQFHRYLPFVMMVLLQASQTQIQASADVYEVEFVNSLRVSILEALVGIITGLREGKCLGHFESYLDPTIQFLDIVASDANRDDHVLRVALGLLGDLISSYGKASNYFLQHPCVSNLISAGELIADQDEVLSENVEYVRQAMSFVATL
jgi:importin subunit beta-1